MKLIAVHDSDGTISMLLTSPSNSPFAEHEIEPGQIKTEVETSDLGFKTGVPITIDLLTEIIENFRVEPAKEPEALGRLTRRPAM